MSATHEPTQGATATPETPVEMLTPEERAALYRGALFDNETAIEIITRSLTYKADGDYSRPLPHIEGNRAADALLCDLITKGGAR